MTVLPFVRPARPRRYLLCPPEHFEVAYAINPWMDPTVPVDRARAMTQWRALRDIYLRLGHEVATGFPIVHSTTFANEGEGDLLVIGEAILAGTGFRTDPRSHAEIARLTGREVVTLRLIDPRFYHLDTALAVLDDATIAYLPEAFDPASRALLADRYPDAIVATEADAAVLGLNAVSDGRHVVLPAEAESLATALAERGFVPVPVELSELRKAGGGPKCCTLELRPARTGSLQEVSA